MALPCKEFDKGAWARGGGVTLTPLGEGRVITAIDGKVLAP